MTQPSAGIGPTHPTAWYAVPLAVAVAFLLAAAAAVTVATPAGAGYFGAALCGFMPVAATVALLAPHRRPHRRFGAGNWTTLLRGVLTGLAAGVVVAPEALTGRPEHAWVLTIVAVFAVALDAADGRLARRQGSASAFGARFDIEVDAWTALVLAAVAVALGAAPEWVLAIGLMHYLFLAAGLAWPALAAPLPPSLRRRLVGGSQTLALGVLVAPPLPADAGVAIAAAALAALTLSFALDVRWLIRTARDVGDCC